MLFCHTFLQWFPSLAAWHPWDRIPYWQWTLQGRATSLCKFSLRVWWAFFILLFRSTNPKNVLVGWNAEFCDKNRKYHERGETLFMARWSHYTTAGLKAILRAHWLVLFFFLFFLRVAWLVRLINLCMFTLHSFHFYKEYYKVLTILKCSNGANTISTNMKLSESDIFL